MVVEVRREEESGLFPHEIAPTRLTTVLNNTKIFKIQNESS